MSQDNEQGVMRTEYDFTNGIRGKHHEAYQQVRILADENVSPQVAGVSAKPGYRRGRYEGTRMARQE